jgi:transposase-like protein
LLQKQDNYISGRRGTGKTTNLLRAYYECLKTISPKLKDKKSVFEREKILPIYIDLSTCNDLFDSEDNLQLIEVHFIRQVIESLKRQLELMFDEKFLLVFRKDNPALEDLEFIEKVLVEGIALRNQAITTVSTKTTNRDKEDVKASLSLSEMNVGASTTSLTQEEIGKKFTQLRGINVQDFLNKINDIKRKAKIDNIFIFIDEYSDLSVTSQKKFSGLLKTFLGSRMGMFFKIGVITDRYDFGDKIIIGRDIFPIPLDFNEYVDRFGGAMAAIKKMQEFIEMLILKRLKSFCPSVDFSQVFKANKEIIFSRISKEAIGVPRTIGMILQQSFIQASSGSSDGRIGLSELNYGISSARKTYQRQFEGSIKKKLLPGFYMDMWNDIIAKAINEKNKHPDRPASHLLIDPIRKEYLNILCENFHLHFLSENIASKYGGNYNLYSIDYDICNELNIKYAEEKDEYTAVRFIYDSVLSNFDPYFTKEKARSYKCPKCNKIYEEAEVVKYKVKRCFDDDEILEEIIHMSSPKTEGNYAEVEIKILGQISSLTYDEAMSAREIADAVGCSIQKVSVWGSRVLAKKGLINIDTRDKNYYYSND